MMITQVTTSMTNTSQFIEAGQRASISSHLADIPEQGEDKQHFIEKGGFGHYVPIGGYWDGEKWDLISIG